MANPTPSLKAARAERAADRLAHPVASARLGWLLTMMGQNLFRRALAAATPEERETLSTWGQAEPLGEGLDPETKMLLVRLCGDLDAWTPIGHLLSDADPGVRWLVFKTMNEMDGFARPKRHDLMIRRAIRWGQAFREGRAKRVPRGFEYQGWGPCDRAAS